MRKLLIALIVLAAVTYGGIKGYLWYEVSHKADRAVNALKPFADITYDGVTSSLSGSVGLTGVRIRPRTVDDDIRIDKVEFQAPDLWFLLGATRELNKGTAPNRMGFAVEGLSVSTSGALMAMLEKGASKHRGAGGDVKNCGNVTFIGADELRSMGYDRVKADIHSHYHFDPASGDLHMYFELLGRDIGDLSMDGVFATDARHLSAAEMMGAKPLLKSATISYADLSYNKRNSEFCAHREGISVDTYIDRSVADAVDQAQRAGLAPQQTLIDAYRQFLAGSGTLTVKLNPPAPVDISTLRFYTPKGIAYQLGPQLDINGQPVDNLPSLWANADTHPQARSQAATAAPTSKQPSAPEATATGAGSSQGASKPRLKTIRVAELEGHLGETARIRITSGREYVGVLEAKRGDKLMLKRQLRGGYMTFPVPLDELDTITLLNR